MVSKDVVQEDHGGNAEQLEAKPPFRKGSYAVRPIRQNYPTHLPGPPYGWVSEVLTREPQGQW